MASDFERGRRRKEAVSDIRTAQDLARESVIGFGEALRPGLEQEIGKTLGGLQSIGALRSGQTGVQLGNISSRFGQQIGAFAKQATALGFGGGQGITQAGLAGEQAIDAERQREDERKGALGKAIGGALGKGLGFVASRFLA